MFFKTCHHLNAGILKTSRLGSLHHLMNFHQRQSEYGQIISLKKSRDYMYTKILRRIICASSKVILQAEVLEKNARVIFV